MGKRPTSKPGDGKREGWLGLSGSSGQPFCRRSFTKAGPREGGKVCTGEGGGRAARGKAKSLEAPGCLTGQVTTSRTDAPADRELLEGSGRVPPSPSPQGLSISSVSGTQWVLHKCSGIHNFTSELEGFERESVTNNDHVRQQQSSDACRSELKVETRGMKGKAED